MSEVAVIGLACRYPEADSPEELWENVLSARRSFRRLPPERLRLEDYYAADPTTPDTTYSQWAALLEDWEFDRVRFRIAGSTFRATDLTHWLALEVAEEALADAGYDAIPQLDRDRVGVIVGNTLTGEFSRAATMRLRWPYVRRVVGAALARESWDDNRRGRFLDELEVDYKAPFPPIGEDSLAGGLSNTIAGRICNMFDLHGGGYTVDGACASSLLAVTNACAALEEGRLDLVVAGGVDLSIDPFELVGFAKTGALAPELMRVFDERSAGFWPGEGCGFVVLARHADAIAWRARSRALVRGWGVSSDGRGGITRPEESGQLLAIRRAYAAAGYGPHTVELFEAHGTGTAIGDATELAALTRASREAGSRTDGAAVGSLKANIGHTKAAAGVGGMIKSVLSLERGLLPPTTGCERPHGALRSPDAPLRVLATPEAWPEGRPLRAGVSAMGFGGINTHVALEAPGAARPRRLAVRERDLARTPQDAELVPLGAASRNALREQAETLADIVGGLSFGQLRDLAVERCAGATPGAAARAAVVARTPHELESRLRELGSALANGPARSVDERRGLFYDAEARSAPACIGFLFPGQASPTYLDGGALARRFAVAREVIEEARLEGGARLEDTAIAQPAIVACSAAAVAVLEAAGVDGDLALGHSLGELVALHWGRALSRDDLLALARRRGRTMAECPGESGAMAGIAADAEAVADLIAALPVQIAAYNAARQVVVSGTAAGVEEAIGRARRLGIRATKLPVSHAFHSPLVAPAAPPLAEFLAQLPLAPLSRRVVSTVEGRELARDADLRALVVRQVTRPVRFAEALAVAAAEADLLIEVGPGRVLSDLAADVGVPLVATDACGPSIAGTLSALAAVYAVGGACDLGAVASGRVAGRKDPLQPRTFLVNPCELAPADDGTVIRAPAPEPDEIPVVRTAASDEGPELVVRRLVAGFAELPLEAVEPTARLLTDLNLNSIVVGQIAVEAASALGVRPPAAPSELANATIADLAAVLAESEPDDGSTADGAAPGLAAWARPFETVWLDRPLVGERIETSWVVVGDDALLADTVRARFGSGAGERGIAICVAAVSSAERAWELVEVARRALTPAPARVAFLHRGAGPAALARTLFLEHPELAVRVIELPEDVPAELVARALEEAETGVGFREVRLEPDGRRTMPELRLLEAPAGELPLGPGDVLLVTGGAKGIGAESGLALARASGCALAALGRSEPTDREVAAHLDRIRAAGVEAIYVQADVEDLAGVRSAVTRVEEKLGRVRGILHAAGVNEPQLLDDLDRSVLEATWAPKRAGFDTVLGVVDAGDLRLLVAYGSIIARSGLRGAAAYAVANEGLRQRVDEVAAGLGSCRCLTLESSVWGGGGMGERLGQVDVLAKAGVSPISPDDGTALLLHLAAAPATPSSVVVCGRYAETPTLVFERSELPLRRFLERPLVHYARVELVAEATLSLATDPYLADHALDGLPLLPAVVGLEAIAQAGGAVAGESVTAIEDVRLPRPIVVPSDGSRTIRVLALRTDESHVEVAIRSDETAFEAEHFRGVCRFGATVEPRPPQPVRELASAPVADDLYRALLFHGPRFQRVRSYRHLHARECVVTVEARPDEPAFSQYLPQELLLGDFAVRDAFVHAAQACVPHRRVLPQSIERVSLLALPEGLLTVSSVERRSDDRSLVYDLAVAAADGSLVEVWEGLTLRAVSDLPAPEAWLPAFFVPYLERRVGELLHSRAVTVALEGPAGDVERAARTERAVAAIAGDGARLLHRADGKPELADGPGVSIAHDTAYTLAVGADGPVACDVELVEPRPKEIWSGLLGREGTALAELLARDVGEPFDVAATRVWVGNECLRKAGRPVGEALALDRVDRDWATMRAGALGIATVATRLVGMDEPLVVGVLADGTGA